MGTKAEQSLFLKASWKLFQGCSQSKCSPASALHVTATCKVPPSCSGLAWYCGFSLSTCAFSKQTWWDWGDRADFPNFSSQTPKSPKQQDAKIKLKKATPLLFCSFTLSTTSSLGSCPAAAPLPWGACHRRIMQVEKMGMRGAVSPSSASPPFHSCDSSRTMGLE